jgi:uncharacterized protein
MAMKTERFEMRLDVESVERIDEWRRKEPDLPSRAEAIRRLVDLGLQVKRKGK